MSAFSSWPTARVVDSTGSAYQRDRGKKGQERPTLAGAARTWPTPAASERAGHNKSTSPGAAERPHLTSAAQDWPTPTSDTQGGGEHGTGGPDPRTKAEMWGTPTAQTGGDGERPDGQRTLLCNQAKRWQTPTARDWKKDDASASPDHTPPLSRQVLRTGMPGSGSSPTDASSPPLWGTHTAAERGGGRRSGKWAEGRSPTPLEAAGGKRKLNIFFVAWLMGLPAELISFAPAETPSYRSWRRQHGELLRLVLGE
ncbi:MAG TPA: hypothetical protein VM389_03045 [Phycisphaerae bacterium]|nr:hypothetical protein [Phycisphaerae bacterium]HUU59298.1 hypothetical protein [Phycisphaerae bacterium]